MTKKLRFRPQIAIASGGRIGWMKHVTAVDMDKENDYAFSGEFLHNGRLTELPAGSVIIDVQPRGSARCEWKACDVYVLREDQNGEGGFEDQNPDNVFDWHDNFLLIRDLVNKLLGENIGPSASDIAADKEVFAFAWILCMRGELTKENLIGAFGSIHSSAAEAITGVNWQELIEALQAELDKRISIGQ